MFFLSHLCLHRKKTLFLNSLFFKKTFLLHQYKGMFVLTDCFCKYGQQYWRGKSCITNSCVVASSSQTFEVEKNIFCPCTDLTLGFLWLQPHVCGGKGGTCLPSFRCPCVKSQITVRGKPRNSLPLVWRHRFGWVANRSPFHRFCCGEGGWSFLYQWNNKHYYFFTVL